MSETSNAIVVAESGEIVTPSARQQVSNINAGDLGIFSTFKLDSQADKIALYSAVTDAEPISDNLGVVINVANVVAQVVQVQQESGQMAEAIRTVLVDGDGKSYAGLSDGLFRAIENIFGILGMPSTWETSTIPMTVVEQKSRKGFKFYTVKLA